MPPKVPEKGTIDRLYVCKKCNARFLFKSDVQEHREATGHNEVGEVSLEG
jgi:DNA-directed RNA polymerase subunit RPC12/RpoP